MHHGGEAHGSDACKFHMVLFLDVLLEVGVGVLQASPHFVEGVRPDSIIQVVLPVVFA